MHEMREKCWNVAVKLGCCVEIDVVKVSQHCRMLFVRLSDEYLTICSGKSANVQFWNNQT